MKRWVLSVALAAIGSSAAMAQEPAAGAAEPCEIHVWASDEYEMHASGLLVGFGLVGGLIDQSGRGDERVTLVDLMKLQLDKAAQFETLGQRDLAASLGMPGARIVWHDDLLTPDQRKRAKKLTERFSASTAPCYAELINGVIFYHRAAMYGSNLFGGFIFRDFSGGGGRPEVASGTVKNPLEAFPPETPEELEAARLELVDAWSRDFDEWVEKKLKS